VHRSLVRWFGQPGFLTREVQKIGFGIDEIVRIPGLTVSSGPLTLQAQMQMRTQRVSGVPRKCDKLPRLHDLPPHHNDVREMRVDRQVTPIVLNADLIAVRLEQRIRKAVESYVGDESVGSRIDLTSLGGSEIDTFVPGQPKLAIESRIFSKSLSDCPIFSRPTNPKTHIPPP